jgi:uncharacterized pyridoxamine 5'-phosphate oxidase family protein
MNANERILSFLKECGTFYYATVSENGARVRPFGFVMLFENKLYFGMGNHKESYRQTVANPNIEICACKENTWMRIRGKAVFDFRPGMDDAVFAALPYLEKLYGPGTGFTHAAFYLEDMEAEIQDLSGMYEKII